MANPQHLDLLNQGVAVWNQWRGANPEIEPDLSDTKLAGKDLGGADLAGTVLRRADLQDARLAGASFRNAVLEDAILYRVDLSDKTDLRGAILDRAKLWHANLDGQTLRGDDLTSLAGAELLNARLEAAHLEKLDLTGADLTVADLVGSHLEGAYLTKAKLTGAMLGGAHLNGAYLIGADLTDTDLGAADLTGADLTSAVLVRTNLSRAILVGCKVFGLAAWGLKLDGTLQKDLVISPPDEFQITIDNLEVSQFIYMFSNNQKITEIVNTLTAKVVLILGRFKPERKRVLNELREQLRRRNYTPVLFDFDRPARHTVTETVTLLARMAHFIIADLSEPSSIPQELQAIIPNVRVPVQPIIESGVPFSMFQDYGDDHWVLPVYEYASLDGLLASLDEKVISPAEGKASDLLERKNRARGQ